MDSGTQRMLERARARRQKLDSQLQSTGQEVTRKRPPLQENKQTQLLKVTTEVEVTLSNPGGRDLVKDVTVSPTKVEFSNKENKGTTSSQENPEVKINVDTNNSVLLKNEVKDNTNTINKEPVGNSVNTDSSGPMRDGVRSRLQRLGILYSDSQISSPIHRTESNFTSESEPIVQSKLGKTPARVARLAALADTIKQWEDDVNQPQLTGLSQEEILENCNRCTSRSNSKEIDKVNAIKIPVVKANKPVSNGFQVSSDQVVLQKTLKQVVWDKAILESLESQGFSRTVSNSRLVYDYSKHSSQDDGEKRISSNVAARNLMDKSANEKERLELPLQKSEAKCNFRLNCVKESRGIAMGAAQLHSSPGKQTSWKQDGSPQKFNVNNSPSKHVWKAGNSPHRFNNSPERKHGKEGGSPQRFTSSPIHSPIWKSEGSPRRFDTPPVGLKPTVDGSVLHKAAMFESTSPNKKPNKDPTELSVSERLALFERNKGQALVPKAAFSMSVPAKYLAKDECSSVKKDETRASPVNVQAVEKPNNYIMRGGNIGSTSKTSDNQELLRPAASVTQTTQLNKVLAQRQKFEQGTLSDSDNGIARNSQLERQKEINMLLNRWNKNKEVASERDDKNRSSQQQEECIPAPPPPPLPPQQPPKVVSLSPLRLPSKLPHVVTMSPKSSPKKIQHEAHVSLKPSAQMGPTFNIGHSQDVPVSKQQENGMGMNSTRQYPRVTDIKRIKVSPPKPGNLYPCLSDIDATTETESEAPYDDEEYQDIASSDEMDSSSNLGDTSFGREILQAAGIHKSPLASQARQQVSSDSDLSEVESAVLEEIDDFLDEALGDNSSSNSDNEGPTPPKRTRETSQRIYHDKSPTTTQSQSFRYSRPVDTSSKCMPTHVIDGDQQMPLMHTVSFYRRQQNMSLKSTPVRHVVRQPETTLLPATNVTVPPDDAEIVRRKISALLDEVSKQQTVISQASQALNLCCSTVEFSGSAEEVEGERLLLLATHKRQATLHEIQRLKVEGSLKPMSQSGQASELLDKGTLIITDIVLPLKKEYLHNMATDDMCHHLLCLVRSQDQVLATQVLAAVPENLQCNLGLMWRAPLKLVDLYSDFKVTLEVYSLQVHKEMLPHNIKYHIGNKKETSKLRLTPKKLLKQESRLMMPIVQSPAGPTAVRSPSFHLAGYVVFSLKEVARSHFTLNKVAYTSPLEGNIQLKMNSELSLEVMERGFLTMFEDVSGFGAWHRRWYLLKGHILAYWKYPDDEKKKEPIGLIDLTACTTQVVGLVSRDICARPNTFLLETRRQILPDDEDSLVLVRSQDCTTIRNLLSADTREERLQWCAQLNKALSMIRAWGSKSRC